jgi:hypothetical protein
VAALRATQQAVIGGLAALGADDVDLAGLVAHIATATTLVDTLHALGLLINVTIYDALLSRLLIAASQPEQARDQRSLCVAAISADPMSIALSDPSTPG